MSVRAFQRLLGGEAGGWLEVETPPRAEGGAVGAVVIVARVASTIRCVSVDRGRGGAETALTTR